MTVAEAREKLAADIAHLRAMDVLGNPGRISTACRLVELSTDQLIAVVDLEARLEEAARILAKLHATGVPS